MPDSVLIPAPVKTTVPGLACLEQQISQAVGVVGGHANRGGGPIVGSCDSHQRPTASSRASCQAGATS